MKNIAINEAELAFRRRTYSLQDNIITINADLNRAIEIGKIEKTVLEIIKSNETLFYIEKESHLKCKIPDILNHIQRHVAYNFSYNPEYELESELNQEIALSFPIHEFNPYVDLFIKSVNNQLAGKVSFTLIQANGQWLGKKNSPTPLPCKNDQLKKQTVDTLNEFIQGIRHEAASKAFKNRLDNYMRPIRKNYGELKDYIDNLFERYSRLLVLRVDLSYEKDNYLMTEVEIEDRFAQAIADREHFFRNTRSNKLFEHMVGYAWKLEYGLKKGFHYHLLFFYDGSKVRQDVPLAQQIGEYWRDIILKGKGNYYNCNAEKDGYLTLGIGMINHYDVKLRENLQQKAAAYLVKPDIYAKIISKIENRRTFGKGVKKTKTNTQGRPRMSERIGHSSVENGVEIFPVLKGFVA
ncbi:MAG TPA: inovirus-type Gp2 protein [Methylobacter sp.]|jgi:hypothetical protein